MSSYKLMRAFGAQEIRTFLRAVDRYLTKPTRIEIIGGSAAALAHGATSTTADVDTFTPTSAELDVAVARATQDTGLKMPLLQAGVADVPINYEDRLERQLPELAMLEVWVLEKHDLVLSKALRWHEPDVQQVREIRDGVGLSCELLIERSRA